MTFYEYFFNNYACNKESIYLLGVRDNLIFRKRIIEKAGFYLRDNFVYIQDVNTVMDTIVTDISDILDKYLRIYYNISGFKDLIHITELLNMKGIKLSTLSKGKGASFTIFCDKLDNCAGLQLGGIEASVYKSNNTIELHKKDAYAQLQGSIKEGVKAVESVKEAKKIKKTEEIKKTKKTKESKKTRKSLDEDLVVKPVNKKKFGRGYSVPNVGVSTVFSTSSKRNIELLQDDEMIKRRYDSRLQFVYDFVRHHKDFVAFNIDSEHLSSGMKKLIVKEDLSDDDKKILNKLYDTIIYRYGLVRNYPSSFDYIIVGDRFHGAVADDEDDGINKVSIEFLLSVMISGDIYSKVKSITNDIAKYSLMVICKKYNVPTDRVRLQNMNYHGGSKSVMVYAEISGAIGAKALVGANEDNEED